ncbi:glycosyltransferase family 9 protein [Ferruginibacter sp. SUN106]|uniref:glycosyltransferase family 9 protein n=1 Tax=Ferruginibacter sp. SUN106 TaxID=2978348 RepID=UPI003D3633C3
MKLLPVKKRKIAILFTAGLGDALLYIPLLKELKKKQFHVTGIFYSRYKNDCLFDDTLLNVKVHINSKLSLLMYVLTRLKHFANIYINHTGGGKIITTAAKICGKRTTKTNAFTKKLVPGKRNKKVVLNFTDAEQNLHLLYSSQNAAIKQISDYFLPHPVIQSQLVKKYIANQRGPYFIVQVSAGNNATPYKNWPVKHWLTLMNMLCKSHKTIDFIILGDATETEYIKAFNDPGFTNCKVLIGKTSVEEAFNLVAHSNGYIGLDSGIMHMAVTLQKKTVSIFGASSETLYGYSFLDSTNHKVIISDINCRPCSGWINANTTRVSDPMQCPDFACLSTIDPLFVYNQVNAHFHL